MATPVESITIGDIASVLCFIASLITSGGIICKVAVKRVGKIMETTLKPINDKLDSVDLSNCKNYLVQALSEIEAGNELNQVARERFWENYDHYVKMGGNSYVHSEVEKLKKEGKL